MSVTLLFLVIYGQMVFADAASDLKAKIDQRNEQIKQLETEIPDIRNSLLASLKNVKPTHLLDGSLWKFE